MKKHILNVKYIAFLLPKNQIRSESHKIIWKKKLEKNNILKIN